MILLGGECGCRDQESELMVNIQEALYHIVWCIIKKHISKIRVFCVFEFFLTVPSAE